MSGTERSKTTGTQDFPSDPSALVNAREEHTYGGCKAKKGEIDEADTHCLDEPEPGLGHDSMPGMGAGFYSHGGIA